MELKQHTLKDAVAQKLLTEEQAEQLWTFLSERSTHKPHLQITHTLYYLGGLIAMGAMSLLMTLGWERFGGWGLLLLACLYASAAIALTEWLLHRWKQPIAAGNTAALAVVMTPLAIYGLQVAMGLWPEGMVYRDYHLRIDWRWIFMELGTLICGAVMLWRYRLPFLVMPIAATLWYMSMDMTELLYGVHSDWEAHKLTSLYFGLCMLALAFWVDIRSRFTQDYAYWLYGFGGFIFWTALTSMQGNHGFTRLSYLCINVLLIGIGAVLKRRILATAGGLGTAIYLSYLAHQIFANSVVFPLALTAIGLSIIGMGILWQRHENALSQRLRDRLPKMLRELLEKND